LREISTRIKTRLGKKVHAIAVFGSAKRPEDYVEGVSDVDIAVIVDDESSREEARSIGEAGMEFVFLTPSQLRELFNMGHPLAWLLTYDSRILHDDGVLQAMSQQRPKFTELTRDSMRRSTLVALSLGVEELYAGAFNLCISHFYHSMRHALRLRALEKFANFPCSDREILATIQGFPAELFSQLVALRKDKKASEPVCRNVLEQLLNALYMVSNLKVPSLSGLQEKMHQEMPSGFRFEFVSLETVNDKVVWVFDVFGEGKLSRWVFDGERLERKS